MWSALEPSSFCGVDLLGALGQGRGVVERRVGELRIGHTVELGYVDQSRDSLDPDRTVYQEITDGSPG